MLQRTEEWYRARAGRITGSRFARAMASKHSDRYERLIDELVDERLAGRSLDGGFINPAMQWGMDNEDAARRWYSRHRGYRVELAGFIVHPELRFVGVSPDGLIDSDGLVEIKCPQIKTFREVMTSQQMPARYRWQVQGQLWVCQRQWLDFVCFFPPTDGVVIRVRSEPRDFAALSERCIEVNRQVERRLANRKSTTSIVTRASAEISTPGRGDPSHHAAQRPDREERNSERRALTPGASRKHTMRLWPWVLVLLVVAAFVFFR